MPDRPCICRAEEVRDALTGTDERILRPMLTFVLLCLVARFSYSLNDIFIGRLARKHGRMEVAAFRGVSLGVSMAPWLLLVPARAWGALAAQWWQLLLTVAVTAAANMLQLHAVRYLPFGLRAALMIATMATCSVLLGWGVLGERLTPLEVVLCIVLIGSAVAVALGSYAVQEIELDVPRGALLTLLAATLMACAVFGVKRLARETHPLLTAWAWEFGSGLILLGPVLLRRRGQSSAAPGPHVWRIATAALPTALASGASVLALDFGELGLWGALGATQIIFTAMLGAAWHRETLGLRRWLCMSVTVAAVAGLALVRG
jgi:drug/metabolite transporter (DMT)-like permease